jgi:hypothetical protein
MIFFKKKEKKITDTLSPSLILQLKSKAGYLIEIFVYGQRPSDLIHTSDPSERLWNAVGDRRNQ